MIRILCLLALCAVATSFAPSQPWGRSQISTRSSTTERFMFNLNEDKSKTSAPALATIDDIKSAVEEEKSVPRSVVKDMNTGEVKEVKWVDPAMRANTRPWEMNWWAYIAFGFPFLVLADDFLHFLPEDGPLGFLGRM